MTPRPLSTEAIRDCGGDRRRPATEVKLKRERPGCFGGGSEDDWPVICLFGPVVHGPRAEVCGGAMGPIVKGIVRGFTHLDGGLPRFPVSTRAWG